MSSTPLPESSKRALPPRSATPESSRFNHFHLQHKRGQVQAFADIKEESFRDTDEFLLSLALHNHQPPRAAPWSESGLSLLNFLSMVNEIANDVKLGARHFFRFSFS
jgi:hypothetical protein